MSLGRQDAIGPILGCRHPVVLAGMGGVARSELVAAVTAAGGFGFLGMVREPVALIRAEVAAVRRLGHERFGVNIIPAATDAALLERQVGTIIELGVPVVSLFWEIDAAVVRRFRDAGIVVVYQVGSPEEAREAERAGAEIVIAQGCEAGGHVRGATPLRRLLPGVVEAVRVPVLAAGGLAGGADLVTVRALGAAGMVLGTALIAATESFAHPHHRDRLVAAGPDDTLLTDMFHINWPDGARVRVLKSAVTAGERGRPRSGAPVVIGEEEGRPIYLFSTDSPLRSMQGDFEAMALYAGTGVGAVSAVRPAGEIIADIVEEAAALSASGALAAPAEFASPVCYAGEMSGAYMGYLEPGEAAAEVGAVVRMLAAGLQAALARPGDGADRPPLAPAGLRFARHILALRPYAGEAEEAGRFGGAVPQALPALILQKLRSLLPRLPETDCRRALEALARELEADMELAQ
ncbi:NAD(P)H-dependent flavin oxidoreductase [Devosia honganensis]|uniref:NAD(P)H-dependent flavin oxidoreductase n=1 Tax=Devosia honganensis TaxID=1610527 RepID=A0ABV7WXB8_9HYPH